MARHKKGESSFPCIDSGLRSRLVEAAEGVRVTVHESLHSLETILANTQAVKTPPRVVVLYSYEFPKWWAEKLLKAFLANGPMPETAIWQEMAKAGIASRTYYKARRQLGIKSTRVGGAAHRGHWVLSLPVITVELTAEYSTVRYPMARRRAAAQLLRDAKAFLAELA